MDVRQLEYFLAVVDHGGFHRAAAALYVAQPSLSQSVRALERDLGAELFHRIGRRVVLTEAGTALVEPAREAVRGLDLARAAVESVHGLRGGRVDVAALPTQAIEPLTSMVSGFAARFPRVSVTLRAAFSVRDIVGMVRTGACELGLVATSGPLVTADVRVHPLGQQRFVLLAPPGGPFTAGETVSRESLEGSRVIVGQEGSGMRRFVDRLRESGVGFEIAVETEHRVSILPLVLGGAGVAVVTDAWRGLAERAGVLVLELDPTDALDVALVSRRGPLTPAARAFLDHALAPTSQGPTGPSRPPAAPPTSAAGAGDVGTDA
ncbi:DNA-binding transcriptional LysR family regulator [Nocardiopsis sp. Huas11]|uniref:LysR family transcriptional regulator n=1 Tax=Nocardiopsis sp. Huas11 TaxID=2183912 RepID=UPI000EAEB58B|nr:LysR family transcriptional regulator [Nocardiopsis sp. Huas11]RKS09915.1 DNA-binding transcriptional LysR family regulator [Nocardiopsis sp. Huas11]